MPVWLSERIMEVIVGPHAAREAGPGSRTAGEVTIPWEATSVAKREKLRIYILRLFRYLKSRGSFEIS